jgi:hypothetical protein
MQFSPTSDDSTQREFDDELAQRLIGKHVLIGITVVEHDGTFVERRQMHGDVTQADRRGIVVRLRGSGEEHNLPPDPSQFQEAPPGEYRLRSTGEVVIDPAYTTSWTLTRPAPLNATDDR